MIKTKQLINKLVLAVLLLCMALTGSLIFTGCNTISNYKGIYIKKSVSQVELGQDFVDNELQVFAISLDDEEHDVTELVEIDTSNFDKDNFGAYKIYIRYLGFEEYYNVEVVETITEEPRIEYIHLNIDAWRNSLIPDNDGYGLKGNIVCENEEEWDAIIYYKKEDSGKVIYNYVASTDIVYPEKDLVKGVFVEDGENKYIQIKSRPNTDAEFEIYEINPANAVYEEGEEFNVAYFDRLILEELQKINNTITKATTITYITNLVDELEQEATGLIKKSSNKRWLIINDLGYIEILNDDIFSISINDGENKYYVAIFPEMEDLDFVYDDNILD